jgi:anti-sigma B factor antagonist
MVLRVSRINVLETDIRKGEADRAVVTLAGELDTSNVAQLYEGLAQLSREGVLHITIDIAELEFVDSTGLSAIISAHKRTAASGGELIVLAPSDHMRRLFEITGIDTYLNLRPAKA